MSKPETKRALNRVLLREAGEHLGTLAEQAKETYDMSTAGGAVKIRQWNRYARLKKCADQVLEIANG